MNKGVVSFFRKTFILLLFVVCGGVLGLCLLRMTGAAENQGLAAGAILLLYILAGMLVGCITGLLVLNKRTEPQRKRILIWVVAVGLTGVLYFLAAGRMVGSNGMNEMYNSMIEDDDQMTGMGFFKPKLFNSDAIYLYNRPDFRKAVDEHSPADTVGIDIREGGGYYLSYAPPYFLPEIMKMDYDMLALRVVAIHPDWLEVVVNHTTGRTMYVKRGSGEFLLWPDFLLSVFSVETASDNPPRIKPLDHASISATGASILRPLLIKGDWILVGMYSDDLEFLDQGWIRWRKNDQLLVTWSLLS